ncbi:hypothetical protein U9M48_033300, partial [Paspalum notatum var. saurae]
MEAAAAKALRLARSSPPAAPCPPVNSGVLVFFVVLVAGALVSAGWMSTSARWPLATSLKFLSSYKYNRSIGPAQQIINSSPCFSDDKLQVTPITRVAAPTTRAHNAATAPEPAPGSPRFTGVPASTNQKPSTAGSLAPPPRAAAAVAPIAAAPAPSEEGTTPPECPAYFRWIHEDLRPWHATGVTRGAVEGARRRYAPKFRVTVVAGRLYVARYGRCFQTRDVFTQWGILQLLRRYPGRVPDLDLVFDCEDLPVVDRRRQDQDQPPLFRYCGSEATLDIAFPDWSFWGWPELNIKPWEALRREISEGNAVVKWTDRAPYAYWKGNPKVGAERPFLLWCNVSSKRDWNARIYAQDWGKEARHGFRDSDLSKQCTHRYKIYVEGRGWSVSEKYILGCDSVALVVRPRFHDFFSRGLSPLRHYWPVRGGRGMCRSIQFAVDWGNAHTDKAQEIGRNASRFVQEELTMDRVYDYMLHLLTEYARLLRYEPAVPRGATEVTVESMARGRRGLEREFMMGTVEDGASGRGPCRLPPPFSPQELEALRRARADVLRAHGSSQQPLILLHKQRKETSISPPRFRSVAVQVLLAMATGGPAAADCRRRTVLGAALSRTSAAFLFLSVIAVGAVVFVSARCITATGAGRLSLTRLPTTAAIPGAAAALHAEAQQLQPVHPSAPPPPPPPPSPPPLPSYSISCPSLNLSTSPTKAPRTSQSQTLARALASPSTCPSAPTPSPPPPPASAASNHSCPSYFRFIHEDLRPWRAAGGVTRAMLRRARLTATFRLLVLGGRAYVQRFRPAFQTRDLFTIWGVLQLLRRYPGRVPDLDLMFDTVDWPVVRAHHYRGKYAEMLPPLFRYCGDDATLDIVFPDWSFWGWPEINIKPWHELQQDLKDGNNRVRWMDREPYAYWKGNPSVSATRKELVKCNVSSTQDWNARIYAQDWFKESKVGYKGSDLGSQCTHRYKIYIEGSAWSISEKYILACDSMTLLVTPKYYDFFSRSLMPIQHYWPVRDDDKCGSINHAVSWGNSHKQLAQRIGKQASNFIQEELTMDHVYDYMLHLLTEYAKLLKFKPTKPPEAVEVCSESLACQAEGLEKKFLVESMVKSARDVDPCNLPPPFDPHELKMLKQRKENSIKQIQIWNSDRECDLRSLVGESLSDRRRRLAICPTSGARGRHRPHCPCQADAVTDLQLINLLLMISFSGM